MRTKVIHIISNVDKSLMFEWLAEGLKQRLELSFVLLNPADSHLESWLRDKGIPVTRIEYKSKKDLFSAFFKMRSLLKEQRPEIIHTHFFEASLVGLLAGKLNGVSKRIHTRHHSTEHHMYYPGGVKYDRFVNWLSTDIVAISKMVRTVLIEKEQVLPEKIHVVHHGFDLQRFGNVPEADIDKLRVKYGLKDHSPVVGVISRYIHAKGIHHIIPAFKKLLHDFPGACLVLANARGNYKDEIQQLLTDIPEDNYVEIAFEQELFALYQLFDVFVHVPISEHAEAFGQTYVEALAAGVPSVFTLSGVAGEFIEDRENALVVNFENSEDIYDSVKMLLEEEQIRTTLIGNGKKAVERFSKAHWWEALMKLYQQIR